MKTTRTLRMNNGVMIPQIALGVWKATAVDECYNSCLAAFAAGYRHIDTASAYHNEQDVGRAIKDSGLNRSDLFITTKLWNDDQGYDSSRRAFDRSLANLALDYVDQYLIHFPVSDLRLKSWKQLEAIYQDGLAKSIGVSNFTIPHLEELLAECNIVPAVNQVEFHPFLNQHELQIFCEKNKILVSAHTPLVRGQKINDARLVNIAKKYGKSNAQILIRWLIEKNFIVIPKSTNPARIKENIEVYDFTLDDSDMSLLNGLHENLRTCRDPTNVP